MILYHCGTMYHLLCCILHKIKYNREKDAVLIISEFMQRKEVLDEIVENTKKTGWFHQVIISPEREIKKYRKGTLSEESTIEEVTAVAESIASGVEKEIKLDFNKFEEINIASEHWSIGCYLLLRKIPYNYFEDASGMLSQYEKLREIIKGIDIINYMILHTFNGFGRNELTKKVFANLSNQQEGFFDERAVDFSISKILSQLSQEEIDKILSIFGCEKIDVKSQNNSVLLMSQYLVNLNMETMEEQKHMYAMLIDHYIGDMNVIVKPHPKDNWINYYKLFENCKVLSSTFPSELLPYCFNEKVKIGFTASSTSILGIADCVEKIIYFTFNIETQYKYTNRYFVVYKMIQNLLKQDYRYYKIEENLEQLTEFLRITEETKDIQINYYNENNDDKKRCIIIDKPSKEEYTADDISRILSNLEDDDIAIFINTNNDYLFYTLDKEEITDNIIPIVIKKEAIKDRYFGDIDDEIIYVYVKSQEKSNLIKSYSDRKELFTMGIAIEINKINSEDYLKIKVLEGKLRAMEVRLREAQENERKCKEELKYLQELNHKEIITEEILLK